MKCGQFPQDIALPICNMYEGTGQCQDTNSHNRWRPFSSASYGKSYLNRRAGRHEAIHFHALAVILFAHVPKENRTIEHDYNIRIEVCPNRQLLYKKWHYTAW